MKKIWNGFISNNNHFTPDNPHYLRAYLNNTMLLGLAVVFLIFTYINHFHLHLDNIFYLDIAGFSLTIVNLILFKKTNNIFFSSLISNIGLMALVLAYAFVLGPSHYALIWFVLIPFLNYFLLERFWGTILYLLFLASNVGLFFYFREEWLEYGFNLEDISNLIISSLCMFFLAVFFDNSNKKILQHLQQSKAEALEANQAKMQFLGKMNREIRTPLNGIIGFTDLLKQTQLDNNQKSFLNNIVESSSALHGIINDVLDFSQLEADKIQLEIIQVDIKELLRSTIDMISFHAQQKDLELLLIVDENMPDFFQADPARLKQVLLYLLRNAVKFTSVGKVTLSVRFSPMNDYQGRFTFLVKDTGVGISNEMKPKLFEAFSGLNQAVSKQVGVGLGLTIASRLVSKMGGEIEFKSDEGVGTDFYFVMESSYKYRLKNETIKGSLAIKKVLLIDSDHSNQLILKENFGRWGVELVISKDEKDAVILLQNSLTFDTVIVENEMSSNDGLNLIRTIREKLNLNAKRLPIILLNSSVIDDQLREVCEKLEVKYILNKPVSASEFYQYLKNIKEETFAQKYISTNERKNKLRSIPFECTILIAEDVKMSMLLIKTLLNKMMPNAKILTASNGLETIQLMQENEVDLVLMDVQMPEMNGLEATRVIRQYEENTEIHVPIIALTAGATIEEKNQCFDYGMDEYLSKPIHLDELFDLLYKYFVTE